jgi:hypothetical protein
MAKLTRLTHKIAIQLHLVTESCTICSTCSRQPVWKLLVTPSYIYCTVTSGSHEHLLSLSSVSRYRLWYLRLLATKRSIPSMKKRKMITGAEFLFTWGTSCILNPLKLPAKGWIPPEFQVCWNVLWSRPNTNFTLTCITVTVCSSRVFIMSTVTVRWDCFIRVTLQN